jgi:CheY-like chemotaxis protein
VIGSSLLSGRRVLLVEDDPILQRAGEASLRQRGLTIITASDGAEGLKKARDEAPDLVLLDLLMPLMPGVELLRALKADAATAGIPVLVLSNSSRDDDKREALALGAAGYLVKANISLKELGDHVERLLTGP